MVISPKEHIEDRIYRIQEEIYELLAKEYVTIEPKNFLNSLSYYNNKMKERLMNVEEDNIKSIRRIGRLLQIIHINLDEVDHIKTTNVPLELIHYLNRILINNNAKYSVLYRPGTEFNYSYWNYTNFMRSVGSGLGLEPDQNLSVISYPLCESKNVLLNCILFHEIAHQLNEELNIRSDIEKNIQIRSEDLDKYVDEWISRFSEIRQIVGEREITLDRFFSENEVIKSYLVEELYEILYSWIDEIISDLIAFYYAGPAFLLALAEAAYVNRSEIRFSETHPPLFLRLKAIFRLYSKLEYSRKLKKYRTITKLIAYYKNISRSSYEKIGNIPDKERNIILERTVIKVIPILISAIENKIKLSKTTFIKSHIESAVNSYMNLIPPVELINYDLKSKRIHDPFTILNSAWIVKENYKTKTHSMFGGNKQKARISINQLTCKALESNDFLYRMEEKD